MLSDWGRPTEGIFQTAFVVEDLDSAVEEFSSRLHVGPWTILRDVDPQGAVYRGQPALATLHVAFGSAGSMTYELVQPVNDAPSVYRDVINDRGYGFHHFGYGTLEFDSAVAAMHTNGYETVGSFETPELRLAIFDTRDALPGMTELIEVIAAPGTS
jgi:Glyoxalase/Bleomycin resistance protein/Dioxygenase superfamily